MKQGRNKRLGDGAIGGQGDALVIKLERDTGQLNP
jgi:hypothetical protein